MRELDYQPSQIARSLKTRQTKALGTVVSDLTNPFFPQLIRGAEDAALEHGYLLFTLNSDDRACRERRALDLLRARKVDGILLVLAPESTAPAELTPGGSSAAPVVFLDHVPTGIAADSVSTDNRKGARRCLHHLCARGHRRIGFLSGWPGLQTAQDRLQGYLDVVREAGLEEDPALIRHGDFRVDCSYRLAKELLLESRPPTAIFAANGMTGLGALKAIHELGLRCPRDVSLAVFDDVPHCDVIQPRLTVVAQPAYEMGRRGAELLIARIEGKAAGPEPVRIELQPELIVRESTGPCPAAVFTH